MDQDLQGILSRVAELGEMSEAEARRILKDVYEDGIVSRPEAEALFLISDSLTKTDPDWQARFVGAIKDYVLTREAPIGWVTEEEANWLIAQVEIGHPEPRATEIEMLLTVLSFADGADLRLSRYVLKAISRQIIEHRSATSAHVELMRRALFAASGECGIWVSQFEASVLFDTNDAIAFAKNDAAWNDLFARAIGNHLMARAHPDPQTEAGALAREAWLKDTSSEVGGFLSGMVSSFTKGDWFSKVTYNAKRARKARELAQEIARREAEQVTQEETAWFMDRVDRDQTTSPAERALINFLKKEAPGFAQGLATAA
ncbi:MAG: hypothetical protein GYB42_02175 [Alphaproteobacteria bacterium]|nr:hypothetical protein [Alphaproteobacteria bacterium]